MKRLIAVVVCLLMLFSLFTVGCGKKESGTESETSGTNTGGVSTGEVSSAEEQSAAAQQPAVPDELSICTWDNWYTAASYAQDLPVFKEIEKKLNIKFKWNVKPASEYFQALDLKLAAGQDLEDVIMGYMDFNKYKNLFTPLNELIDKNGPNVKALLAERPDVKAFITTPDGTIYSLCIILKAEDTPFGAMFLRKDWLDKYQLPMPATTDDFYNVMNSLRDKDPNGNKKKDEVYAVHADYYCYFGDPFDMHITQSYYSINKNGEMEYDFLMPRGKAYLSYLNKLFKAGILDPEIIGMKYETLTARFGSNQVAATHWYNRSQNWLNDQVKKTDPNVNYRCVVLSGPDGAKKLEMQPQTSCDAVITKSCKKPEVAMKFFDFMWSKEGENLVTYGIENDTYTMVDGKPAYTDKVLKNPDKMSPQDILWSIGCMPNLVNMQDNMAFIAQTEPQEVIDTINETKKYIEPFDLFTVTRPTAEESKDLLNTDLDTYIREMIVKFITGVEPLDNYDKFGEKLKQLGIDKLMKAKKSMNDRAQSAK